VWLRCRRAPRVAVPFQSPIVEVFPAGRASCELVSSLCVPISEHICRLLRCIRRGGRCRLPSKSSGDHPAA
jgi:hypothetical protein